MSRENLDLRIAVGGMVIAAVVNSVAKAALASPVGDREIVWFAFGERELRPYYERAEKLFRVTGTRDPLDPFEADLRPPPPLERMNAGGRDPTTDD